MLISLSKTVFSVQLKCHVCQSTSFLCNENAIYVSQHHFCAMKMSHLSINIMVKPKKDERRINLVQTQNLTQQRLTATNQANTHLPTYQICNSILRG